MQRLEVQAKKRNSKHRNPVGRCHLCGEIGHQYIRSMQGHRYIYTKHVDQGPIGRYNDGSLKYKICFGKGRLYNSIEESLEALKNERKLKKSKVKKRATTITHKHQVNCPRCHHRGRLQGYKKDGIPMQVMVHERIPGTWGKSKKTKYRRCFLGKVVVISQ